LSVALEDKDKYNLYCSDDVDHEEEVTNGDAIVE